MRTCGIDPATHVGLALYTGKDSETEYKAIKVKQIGFARVQAIAYLFKKTIEAWKPDLVIIEKYAFVRNIDSFVCIVEIGTAMKQILHDMEIPWLEVPPTVLKKWTTGKGNADKKQMKKAAEERWDFVNNNHDIVDAYALARMSEVGIDKLKEIISPKKKPR